MKTKEKNKPQYVRLYQILRGQIESGAIAYGSRLPSKRVTAERYGVSLSTVEHALRLLEEEGYLLARLFCLLAGTAKLSPYACGATNSACPRATADAG